MGFLTLFAAGLCQGSFGLGYKNYKPFSWPVFWGVYDLMCIITSLCAVILFTDGYLSIAEPSTFGLPILCGALWGLSAIGFSKGIDKIGMSLVYGISMGISTVVGSVTPMIMSGNFPKGSSLFLFAAGLVFTLGGVAVITIAGIKRDGAVKSSKNGILLSILSGLGSGAMNIGFSSLDDFGKNLTDNGCSDFGVSAAKWFPVLLGGCIAGIFWCLIEAIIKKELHTLVKKGSIRRVFALFGVSIVWYLALVLYGLAAEMLGEKGATVGWILFNALALMVSVFWGLKTGEWKGSKKTLLFLGCGILIIAWIFTAGA